MEMKIPPQAVLSEQYLLGACINQPSILKKTSKILISSDFYREAHEIIFQAMLDADTDLDLSVLAAILKKSELLERAGGLSYVMGLAIGNNTAAWEYHANRVKEFSQKRQLLQMAQTLASKISDENAASFELADSMRKWLTDIEIGDNLKTRSSVDLDNVYTPERCIEEYEKYISTLSKNRFITGIHEIDAKIRGVAGGELLFVIARAGTFKTAILQNLLKNYIQNSAWGAVFFSLEMPVPAITERYHEISSGVSGWEIESAYRENSLHRPVYQESFIKNLKNLFIVPSRVSIPEIIQYVKLIEKHWHLKIGVLGIDYLGLMDGQGKGEYEIVSNLARDLKNMAKLINLPVIAIAQTSRRAGVGETEIMLDHARGSGAIEEAADFVLGTFKHQDDLILKILKNRKGRTGHCFRLDLDPVTLRLGPNAEDWEPPKKKTSWVEGEI